LHNLCLFCTKFSQNLNGPGAPATGNRVKHKILHVVLEFMRLWIKMYREIVNFKIILIAKF
jgi:hypothetical protein